MILNNLVGCSCGKGIALTGQKGTGDRLRNRSQMINVGAAKGKGRDGQCQAFKPSVNQLGPIGSGAGGNQQGTLLR